jgi:hypothetical protein
MKVSHPKARKQSSTKELTPQGFLKGRVATFPREGWINVVVGSTCLEQNLLIFLLSWLSFKEGKEKLSQWHSDES